MHRREALLKSLLKHFRGSSQIVETYNLHRQMTLHMASDLWFEKAGEELLHSDAKVGCAVPKPQVILRTGDYSSRDCPEPFILIQRLEATWVVQIP